MFLVGALKGRPGEERRLLHEYLCGGDYVNRSGREPSARLDGGGAFG
jgi:hypothetical protein